MTHTRTYHFETLDEATQDYLRLARDSGGSEMPGVYVEKTNYLPMLGLLIGVGLIAATLILTLPPHFFDNPTNEAMLQTAGLLVGGWMVITAFRVWMAKRSPRYLGHFVYADARHVWDASGAVVRVTDIGELREAKATENYSEEKYQNTSVALRFPGERVNLTMHDEEGGQQLMAFLNHLVRLRGGDGRGSTSASPVVLGAMARIAAHTGKVPAAVSERHLAVSRLPKPTQVSEPRSGMVTYALIIAAAVGGVIVMREVDTVLRDDAVFEDVKDQNAPLLRAYLLDKRCTAHRADVEHLLARYYEPLISRLKERAKAPGQEWVAGLAEVLDQIKSAPVEAVSIRADEARDPARAGDNFGDAAVKMRQEEVEKKVANGLVASVGQDRIAFAQAPTDVPPMIELSYKYTPAANPQRRGEYDLQLSVQFRRGPEQPVIASKTWPARPSGGSLRELRETALEAAQQMLTDLAGGNGPPFLPQ
jgi:hypothetical protein